MRVAVHAPSDNAGDLHPWEWRDYWVKTRLGDALHDAGAQVVFGEADLDIWLWGWNPHVVPEDSHNVLWLISHPELLIAHGPIIRRAFQKVFCSSALFMDKLREIDMKAELLICPPPRRVLCATPDPVYELTFVGNADPRKNRPALVPVLRNHKSMVYGKGWGVLLKEKQWGGNYVAFQKLHEVWGNSAIVPYSHHIDMRQHGFVADSALDVIVNSEALLISDKNPGWEALGLPVPEWESTEDLERLVTQFLAEPKELQARITFLKEKARFVLPTYEDAAKAFLEGF